MTHRDNWNDLQYILAVAETGTLSGAARRLGVNHATVLRRISAFELDRGTELFERTGQGYRLRAEAHPILEDLRDIARTMERVERSIHTSRDPLEGVLRITTTDSVAKSVMTRPLNLFRATFPNVQLQLSVTNSRLNFDKLDADLTIRPARELSPDLEGRRVCDLAFKVYGGVAYLAERETASPEEHDWLGVTETLAQSPVGTWLSEHAPESRIVCRADSFVTLADAAANGLGLAMIPTCLGETYSSLTPASRFPDRLVTGLWVAAHRDLRTSERARTFLDFFESALSAEQNLLSA